MHPKAPDPLPSHLDCIEDIFAFVRDVMVVSLSDERAADRLRFILRQDERYNAGVLPLSASRFNVFLNTATATRLFDFCGVYGVIENDYLREHFAELEAFSIDENAALALSYYTGLIFVAMHEYAHVASGHLSYDRAAFGDGADRPLSFTETDGSTDGSTSRNRDTERYRRFRRISELEADGVAFALTFSFAPEIAMLTGLDPEQWDERKHAIHRAILLGCFAALCLLEGLFADEEEIDGEYPFPGMRLINLCSSYFRVVDPDAVAWEGDDYRTRVPDPARNGAVETHYAATIGPALFALNDALVYQGMETRFFRKGFESDPDAMTPFMRDIISVLGGSTPDRSPDGRLLASLSASRADFVLALERYRELDLWPTA